MIFFKDIIAGVWLFFIVIRYFEFNPYYYDAFRYWQAIGLLIFAWGVLGVSWFFFKKIRKQDFVFTPIKTFLFLVFSVSFTGSIFYLAVNPLEILDPLDLISTSRGLSDVSFSLALMFLKIFGSWIFFAALFYGSGAFILRHKKITLLSFFESIGIGMAGFMAVLFFLGIFGFLRTPYLWSLIGIIFLFISPHIFEFLKLFLTFCWTISYKKISQFLIPGLFGVMFFSSILLGSVLPFPLGFDTAMLYHNRVNLIVEYGHLVEGIPYNFELILVLSRLLWHDPVIAFELIPFTAFLGFIFGAVLIRRFFRSPQIFELIVLLLSLTIVRFFLQTDMKNDFPLLFFDLIFIHYGLAFLRSKVRRERLRNLILFGLLGGGILGIKYTSILLIITVFILWAVELWNRKIAVAILFFSLGVLGFVFPLMIFESFSPSLQNWIYGLFIVGGSGSALIWLYKHRKLKEALFTVGIAVFFMGVSFSPWVVKNALQAKSFNPSVLISGGTAAQFFVDKPSYSELACSPVFSNDYDHFTGEGSLSFSLFLPFKILWESTMNRFVVPPMISDISFLWLGFLGFVVFHWKKIAKKNLSYRKLTLYTLLFFGLWLITSQGIFWHGLPMLLGFLVIYGKIWDKFIWMKPILTAWLVLSLSSGIAYNFSTGGYLYAQGFLDNALYLETVIPGANAVLHILNQDEVLDKNVYAFSNVFKYHVRQNDRRFFSDEGNKWECYIEDPNPQITLQNLRAENFGYVLFSDFSFSREIDASNVPVQRFSRFKEFVGQYLILEAYSDEYHLYRVPDV